MTCQVSTPGTEWTRNSYFLFRGSTYLSSEKNEFFQARNHF